MVLEKKVLLEHMTWKEAKQAVEESKGVVIVPVGATEQHGPHLSLDVDTISTVETAVRAAKKAKAVVAPTIPYGNSEQNMDFPGTVAIKNATLIQLLKDVADSLIRQGFDKIILLNGHGGNVPAFNIAAEEIDFGSGKFCCHIKCWELASVEAPKGTPEYDGHGGSQETSLLLALRPEDVYEDEYIDSKPEVELGEIGCIWPPQNDPFYSPAPINLMAKECVKYGHFGDPKYASAERGEKVLEAWADSLVRFIELLKNDKLKWRKQ